MPMSSEQRLDGGAERARLRLATALSMATTVDELSAAVAEWAGPAAGATFANLALYDPTGNTVRAVHSPTLDDAIAARWAEFPIETPTPLCEAILTGHAVLLRDLQAIGDHYRLLLEDTIASGLAATASIPLHTADGSTVGAVGLGWPEPQEFPPALQSRMDLVAGLVVHALERLERLGGVTDAAGLLLDRSHIAQVQAVQDAIVSAALPPTEHLELAATYLPASEAPIGGDWYDAFPVDGGTCLVIGDIAGHGIEAAAAMAEFKYAIRAFASEDPRPAGIVERANRMMCRGHPDLTATVIVAVWDPVNRTIRRCNAGHPPVMRCRSGEFDYLTLLTGANPMIGAAEEHRYREEAKELRPGTTLVLYSDGLIEQPPSGLDETMADLLRFAESRPSIAPQRLVDDILLWRLRQGPCRDDLCVMAVRLA